MGIKQGLVGLLLLLTGMPGIAAMSDGVMPQLGARIADHASVISKSQKHLMHQLLAQHEHSNHNHVMIMTVESTGSDSAEAYAKGLWQTYAAKRRQNSVLLLLVKDQGAAAIIAGDKFSKKLDAARVKEIIDGNLSSPLKAGDYDSAAMEGIKAIVGSLNE